MNYRKIFLIIFFGAIVFGAPAVFADTLPVVTSFTASASSIAHGYGITFNWTVPPDQYYGADFYFTCPPGVTIQYSDGANFICNSYGTVGAAVTYASANFYVKNVSGSTQTVAVRIVPKDSAGLQNTAGAMQTSFTVTPLAQPIASFTASVSPFPLNTNVTLSWTGYDIVGANLQFDCVSGVHITSVSPVVTGDLPCGTTAYASDLAASGAVVLNFANDSAQATDVSVRVLPAFATRTYDGGHTLSLTRSVSGKAATALAAITAFSASSERVVSGNDVTFSWKAENATSSNLQIQCTSGVEVWGVDSPATTTAAKLSCGNFVFSSAPAATASAALTFKNLSGILEQVMVTALPRRSDGNYDATNGRTITLTVLPVTATPSATAISIPSVAASAAPAPTSVSMVSGVVRTYTFTTPLYFGLRGTAISELQKFLAQDKTLYPEGLTTGYFGPLTELAVRRFQKRYGLAQEGDPAFGFVGPKTRAKLNTLEQF